MARAGFTLVFLPANANVVDEDGFIQVVVWGGVGVGNLAFHVSVNDEAIQGFEQAVTIEMGDGDGVIGSKHAETIGFQVSYSLCVNSSEFFHQAPLSNIAFAVRKSVGPRIYEIA